MALPQGPPVGKPMDVLCSPDSRPAWPTKLLVLPLTERLKIQVRETIDRPLRLGTNNVYVPWGWLSELRCHNAGSSTMHAHDASRLFQPTLSHQTRLKRHQLSTSFPRPCNMASKHFYKVWPLSPSKMDIQASLLCEETIFSVFFTHLPLPQP